MARGFAFIFTTLLATLPLFGAGCQTTNYIWGNVYFKRGEYRQAISYYSKYLEENPGDARGYYMRGRAYHQSTLDPDLWSPSLREKWIDRAIADYSKAVGIDPKLAPAYFYRAFAYSRKGQDELALADYTKALELDPKMAWGYNNRGEIYRRRKEYDVAIADYNRALDIDPGHAAAYNNRGAAYGSKGQHDQAISDLNKALEIDPQLTEAYLNRGVAHRKKGEHDQAIADLNRGIELKPKKDLAGAYYERAVTYYEMKDYKKAWEDLRSSQALGHEVDPELMKSLKQALGK